MSCASSCEKFLGYMISSAHVLLGNKKREKRSKEIRKKEANDRDNQQSSRE